MTRVFCAQLIVLGLGLLGVMGCYPGTTFVPGDPTRFDPVAAFPKAAAYAGPSTKFLALDANYVREDGTVDLEARYVPDSVSTIYYFVQPQPSSDDTDVPIGVRTVRRSKFLEVFIGIRRTDWDHFDGGWFHGGMSRSTTNDSIIYGDTQAHPVPETFDTPTPPPRCSFAKLWAIARQRGAPAGAVAVIAYDSTGYRFRIDGTPFRVDFDTDCTVKPR